MYFDASTPETHNFQPKHNKKISKCTIAANTNEFGAPLRIHHETRGFMVFSSLTPHSNKTKPRVLECLNLAF